MPAKEELALMFGEFRASLTQVVEARFANMEREQKSYALAQAGRDGEMKATLHSTNALTNRLQLQMSALVGEGPIDGRIGTMTREILQVREEARESMTGLETRIGNLEEKFGAIGWRLWFLAAGFLGELALLFYQANKR
jgi:hypothetical protein